MKPYEFMSESELQESVANYLVREYPDVMFHSDFGSGVKLTPAQAKRQKRQNGYRKGWPDLFIAQERATWITPDGQYEPMESLHALTVRWKKAGKPIDGWKYGLDYGLFLELKKEGTRLKKKNGEWATEHIAEQAKVLEKLRQRGYCAEFAVGFEEAKRIIDGYLGS